MFRRRRDDPPAKTFAIPGPEIRPVAPGRGSCLASDRITVVGRPVGYAYREEPGPPPDSGWRFFAGDESQEYADDADNFEIYDVNTIANYDPDIASFLDLPAPVAIERPPAGGPLAPIP